MDAADVAFIMPDDADGRTSRSADMVETDVADRLKRGAHVFAPCIGEDGNG